MKEAEKIADEETHDASLVLPGPCEHCGAANHKCARVVRWLDPEATIRALHLLGTRALRGSRWTPERLARDRPRARSPVVWSVYANRNSKELLVRLDTPDEDVRRTDAAEVADVWGFASDLAELGVA
jgi:hypothetical protein